MANVVLDPIDRRLLRLLQTDAHLTREELGQAVGLSAPAVHQRIRRLETDGLITGYHARVDASRVGRGVMAFMRVTPGAETDVSRVIKTWETSPAVLECHQVGGDGGFLLKLRLASLSELGRHLDVARRAGCRATADVTLETVFERWAIPAGAVERDYL